MKNKNRSDLSSATAFHTNFHLSAVIFWVIVTPTLLPHCLKQSNLYVSLWSYVHKLRKKLRPHYIKTFLVFKKPILCLPLVHFKCQWSTHAWAKTLPNANLLGLDIWLVLWIHNTEKKVLINKFIQTFFSVFFLLNIWSEVLTLQQSWLPPWNS